MRNSLVLTAFIAMLVLSAPVAAEKWKRDAKTGCAVFDEFHGKNTIIRWFGPCQGGKANGHGVLLKHDDLINFHSIYIGGMRNGMKHGTGTENFDSGSEYTGNWRNGRPHGHGTYSNGGARKFIYEGRWNDGCVIDDDFGPEFLYTTEAACGF